MTERNRKDRGLVDESRRRFIQSTVVGSAFVVPTFAGLHIDLGGTTSVCGGNELDGLPIANSASAVGWAKTTGTVS